MELPEFLQIGLRHAWWFTAVFGMGNVYFLLRYPRRFSRRVFRFPSFDTLRERVVSYVSVAIFMRGLMLLTVFVPMRTGTVWFYSGLAVFIFGFVLYTNAMVHFAEADPNSPVVTGVYRISRHPMQVFSLVMWVGVGLATASPVILGICCIQPLLARVYMIAQERFCVQQYGEPYREYLARTPRFLGVTQYNIRRAPV